MKQHILLIALMIGFMCSPAAGPALARQASAVAGAEVRVVAEPLGVWCDSKASFFVSIENVTDAAVYIGVPKRASLAFPYLSSARWQFGNRGGVSAGACGCEGGGCALCERPESVVTLAPHERLTWTYEIGKLDGLQPGAGRFSVTLFWYGSANAADARTRTVKGTADLNLTVSPTDGSCLIARGTAG
jgi:hypothetical protein